jgi:Domain of unknown function (DUF397)
MKELAWRKSSYSGSSGGNCVEVAALPGGGFAVRDSKDANGPVLDLSTDEWRAFVCNVKTAG